MSLRTFEAKTQIGGNAINNDEQSVTVDNVIMKL